ncbi:cytidine deaminase-like [Acropora millepora]|uniref:cytidine deaminase-like n=1 Tax=Acropora millepora TaxID=45264 RepID=UPI001CF513B4|nr:cytidine deaminase-like [Acropora millepora]
MISLLINRIRPEPLTEWRALRSPFSSTSDLEDTGLSSGMVMARGNNNNSELIDLEISTLTNLLKCCIKAKEYAYSPYSKFRVGAALLTDTGEIIDGCSVDNASYGLSICAERTALVKAVSMGFRKFPAIAVTADLDEFVSPCGACRQFIAEFGLECDVYLVKPDLSYKKVCISELLPMPFTSTDLESVNLQRSSVFEGKFKD